MSIGGGHVDAHHPEPQYLRHVPRPAPTRQAGPEYSVNDEVSQTSDSLLLPYFSNWAAAQGLTPAGAGAFPYNP